MKTSEKKELLLRLLLLCLIYLLTFAVRLFSVVSGEATLQEFDPHFNYRSTVFLARHGLSEFWNWFDPESWYPLGRAVGGTVFPGLMVTASFLASALRPFLFFDVDTYTVCVLLPPFFAANTAVLAYFLGAEVWDRGAGLVAAALLGICPGYTSRSVAGAYDNESVAIFALLLVFYLFLKAVSTGSAAWSLAAAVAYLYLVSAWGGYVYAINLIPLYVVVLLVTGRYSVRLYIAYSCTYVLGALLAMQIRFVGFQHAKSGEHMASMAVFFLVQVFCFLDWVKHSLKDPKLFQSFSKVAVTCAATMAALTLAVGTASGYISPWAGRLYSLLDPTHAKANNPIIASVMEHEPTTWASFMYDFQVLLVFFPAGLYFCFKRLTEATVFLVVYGVTSVYFAGVMVRLVLVAAPAMCLVSAVAVSATLKSLTSLIRAERNKITASYRILKSKSPAKQAVLDQSFHFQKKVAAALLLGIFLLLSSYAIHSTWVTRTSYSSPSIFLQTKSDDGNTVTQDDHREAYFWLNQNTPPGAKIMSWWDYGYQISALAKRTVIVDNNTWNTTHIAVVGRAMVSGEEEAYEIIRSLDVDYVLVVFGGVAGFQSDDIDKFLWMVRIAGGVFPDIKEADYLVDGEYRIDRGAAPKMLNSLIFINRYKLCYYRFGDLSMEGRPPGFDRARWVEIGSKNFELKYLEEAFTTANWLVRIYKVKAPRNRR